MLIFHWQDGGESPSDFPYHSFLCDQIEIEEFVAEQEKCVTSTHFCVVHKLFFS